MSRIGKPLRPVGARIDKGGKYTTFSVIEKHSKDGKTWINDGFVGVRVPGTYDFVPGDVIYVDRVVGWTKRKSSTGIQYFTVLADRIRFVKKEEAKILESDASETLLNDIAEEFLYD